MHSGLMEGAICHVICYSEISNYEKQSGQGRWFIFSPETIIHNIYTRENQLESRLIVADCLTQNDLR